MSEWTAPRADVVAARCQRGRSGVGITVRELRQGTWTATWAFPTDVDRLQQQGYAGLSLSGQFAIDDRYPGCPSCGSRSFFQCGQCRRVSCWNSEAVAVVCAWCGQQGEVSGTIASLQSAGDG